MFMCKTGEKVRSPAAFISIPAVPEWYQIRASKVGRKVESSSQRIIRAIFIFLTPPSTVNSQQSLVLSHQSLVISHQSLVNSQQSTVNNDSGATGIDISLGWRLIKAASVSILWGETATPRIFAVIYHWLYLTFPPPGINFIFRNIYRLLSRYS